MRLLGLRMPVNAATAAAVVTAAAPAADAVAGIEDASECVY